MHNWGPTRELIWDPPDCVILKPTRSMPLRLNDLNRNVVDAQYAVRGALALRAEQLREQLHKDPGSLPFKYVINANIGNPQQLDQAPITFYRQVLSLVQYPKLIESPPSYIKPDAVRRAKFLLDHIGSVGAYSASNGVDVIRESVARFIEERDGYPADPDCIYLTAGASTGVANLIRLVARPGNGVLIPIPQYPLYSASLSLEGAVAIHYHLSEKDNWTLHHDYLERRINEAAAEGIKPTMLCVINPGNPTGSVMPDEDIENILKIAHEHDLVVLADEVYQANIFEGKFHSFKKIRQRLVSQDPKYNSIQLASVHSTSKGYIGECGQRGGYLELVGFHQDVLDQIYKMASISLCPVVSGQVLTELMVNPPKEGDESFDEFTKETSHIRETLRERAQHLYEAFKGVEGVSCYPPQGAMYLYPFITLPARAVEEAAKRGMQPDEMYCMDLLNETGICVIPGSGFGQEKDTFHFRTTFLAPGGDIISDQFVAFHKRFIEKWH